MLFAVHAIERVALLEALRVKEYKPLCHLLKTGLPPFKVSPLALANWLGCGVIPRGGAATRRGGKNSHNYTIYYY